MDKLRLGIIGLGGQGRLYADRLQRGLIENAVLTAVWNRSEEGREWARKNLGTGVTVYENLDLMLGSGGIDAVIICVPHFLHPEFAIKAFENGLHVLLEKPAGVTASSVEEMNEVAAKSGKTFALLWNLRAWPVYRKLKAFLVSGELGGIRRVMWITTNWYRTQYYYDSGSWRATWRGEGGGVLVNQCSHNLDMLQYLAGMPESVHAFCRYGVHRDIEVENDVTAYFTFPNGAVGSFIASTYEFPGTNRLEISGENGKVVLEDGRLVFFKSSVNETAFNETNSSLYEMPVATPVELKPENDEREDCVVLIQNFANAVLKGEELLCPGTEGVNEVRLCNAIQLSDWTGRAVDPIKMDTEEYDRLLRERIEISKKI
ncbi:MAG: Gfo/Idh/MocA family oxidoreductase [Eubacteriales bacterium]|nr:Gfo/Idh/MocA family oxidoreductase [Eubacteriales bacterium]